VTRLILVLLSVTLVPLFVPRASAHEIGTTRVSVRVSEKDYRVEIVTDAAALADKLETLSGRSVRADAPAAQLQHLINAGEALFRQRVHLRFDAIEVQPSFEVSVTPAPDPLSAPAATIRLTGSRPSAAVTVAWQYGWTFSSYSLGVAPESAAAPDPVWLEGDESSQEFALDRLTPPPGRVAIARRYLALGFTHILPGGLDHVLFVIGLYLLSRRTSALLWQVSAFTLAHSITLGLSMYDVLAVPSRIVEPLIAVSIAYVAIENIVLSELRSWRVALVFGFGLLHGLGFAGVLKELGLPRSEFVTALVTFNAGVEAGQLAVIAGASALVGWHARHQLWYRRRVVIPASMLIASTALYWTVERLYP
jgi:hypothetical protein